MGLGTLNSVMVSASTDFTGVAVDGDYHNIIIPLTIIIVSSLIGIIMLIAGGVDDGRHKGAFESMVNGIAKGVFFCSVMGAMFASIIWSISAGVSNHLKKEDNFEAIESHYSVDLIGPDGSSDSGLLGNPEEYTSVQVEYESSLVDGYLKEVEEDRWAVLVSSDEDPAEFIEFDDEEIGNNLEEMGAVNNGD